MSVQKVNVLVPQPSVMPPGAVWIVNALAWLFVGGARVASALAGWRESVRARQAIDRMARHDARSRAEVIALARRYESTQPEFAKDLYAAARSDRQI